jgi:hypothetical protein
VITDWKKVLSLKFQIQTPSKKQYSEKKERKKKAEKKRSRKIKKKNSATSNVQNL